MREFLRRHFQGDRVIWAVIITLFVFSLLAVYSSTGSLAYKYQAGDTTYYLLRQLKFLLLGIVLTYIVHKVPYRLFMRMANLLLIVSIPLLIITLFFGISKNEAARWLSLPGLDLAFQTSDFAKVALIMYVAKMLSLYQDDDENRRKVFKPIMIAVVVVCGLILPANLSTAVLLFGTSFLLMFIGRIHFRQLLLTIGVIVAAFGLLVLLALTTANKMRVETWKNRFETFVNPEKDSYQSEQSKIAVVTGGVLGKGPGNSTQRNFLPHPYSDFIFAIIIEEYGLMGGTMVVFLYLYLLFRTILIVRRSDRTFPAFLSIGLVLNLVLQGFTNMAVAVGLLPVTGQPLPLISMGGTSIMFTSISLGMLLSISRTMEERLQKPEPELATN